MKGISTRTEERIEKFIKKHQVVYYSEVRALQKKKTGEDLIPKVNFDSLQFVLKKLEEEKKISISFFGSVKTITWIGVSK